MMDYKQLYKLIAGVIDIHRRPMVDCHPGNIGGLQVLYIDKITWYLKHPN